MYLYLILCRLNSEPGLQSRRIIGTTLSPEILDRTYSGFLSTTTQDMMTQIATTPKSDQFPDRQKSLIDEARNLRYDSRFTLKDNIRTHMKLGPRMIGA